MGYIGRHWRGELSLPVSFWVNNVLLLAPLGFAIGLLMAWISGWGQGLQTSAITMLAGGALLGLLSVWAPVGAWRAAGVYREQGGSAGWALATRALLLLGLLSNLGALVVDVLPEMPQLLRMAAGQDPIGRLDITLSADGRIVTLTGPIGMGSATRFERTLQGAPQLQRVVLQSPGGRLFEAHQMATQVRLRGLQTRATGDCASACTLVFIAGGRRSLAPAARLGFHRASVPSMNPLHEQMANAKLASLYRDAGLPRDFIFHVLATPASTIWNPATDQLVAAGILPPPTLLPELDTELPADAPLDHYRDALNNNLLWTALEQRRSGAIADAAQRMLQARHSGMDLAATALEGQAVALAAVPTVLRSAGTQALDRFMELLAAELRERRAAGDAACQTFLSSAVTVTPPAANAAPQRLADWLQTALLEPAEPQLSRPLTPLELEVLRRELGDNVPERIAALGPSRGTPAPGCTKALELLDAMARMRPPQRRLAARLMLNPPA
jgi:hypothetical protein